VLCFEPALAASAQAVSLVSCVGSERVRTRLSFAGAGNVPRDVSPAMVRERVRGWSVRPFRLSCVVGAGARAVPVALRWCG
jgi:hypothetical protein